MLMLEFILSQINPFHILWSYYLKSILIVLDHIYLGIRSRLFLSGLGAKFLLVTHFSSAQYMSFAAHSRVTYPFAILSSFLDSLVSSEMIKWFPDWTQDVTTSANTIFYCEVLVGHFLLGTMLHHEWLLRNVLVSTTVCCPFEILTYLGKVRLGRTACLHPTLH